MTRPIPLSLLPVGLLALSQPARGDDAAAEMLLKQGQQLIKEGKLAEACPTFAKALQLNQHPRLRLNLADCYEKQGKLASAWGEYVEAARAARNLADKAPKEQERVAYAEKKARELEPRLSFLKVDLASKIADLRLTRNDSVIPDGTKIPVDRGKHTISAAAPGRKPWKTEIEIEGEATTKTVVVPALEAEGGAPAPASSSSPPPAASSAPPPPAASSAAAAATPTTSAQIAPPKGSTAGWALTGAGAVVAGVGAFIGLRALSTYKEAKDACPTRVGCAQQVLDKRDSAGLQANIANAAVGGGLVLAGVGVYLLITSGGEQAKTASSRLRVAPEVGPGQLGVSLGGRLW